MTWPFVDGYKEKKHAANFAQFKELDKNYDLILNEKKCVYRVIEIKLLGYKVSKRIIRLDPERLRPLWKLPPPQNVKSQRRIIKMFVYYSHWIPNDLLNIFSGSKICYC